MTILTENFTDAAEMLMDAAAAVTLTVILASLVAGG